MIKKLILLGFGLVLLIGLPLVLYLLQQQTQPTSKAAAVTVFSFDGPSSVNSGQALALNLNVDPGGQNQVSFVKFTFSYDSNALNPATNFISINTSTYTVLASPDPVCNGNQCTVTRTISVGTNQNAIIKSKTSIATVNFTATNNANSTQLSFVDNQNQALSVGSADQPAENVFQSGTPFPITISTTASTGGTTPTITTTPAPPATSNPPSGGGAPASTISVGCTSFIAQPTSGNPPLATTFTTVASSSNDTIAQLAINYGDGSTDTIASGSGIGTGSLNNQITHTYSNNGVFTAQATVTTSGGATNPSGTCKTTVTVGSAAATLAGGGKLPPTGPGQTIMFVGVAGAILSVLGGLIFLGL